MIQSIPKLSDIIPILFNESNCIEFLFEEGILVVPQVCSHCGGLMRKHELMVRCTKDICRKAVSIFKGSFFAGQRLKCCEVLYLGYLWLTHCTHATIMHHTGHSEHTVTSYMVYFRQLVSEMIDTDDTIIGGPGVVVQIDETKFGKRKYNRGHRVDGTWVIVGVEITDERLLFAEVVPDRTAVTIENVLSRHVAEGSIIHTDCWRGYSSISSRFNIEHRTVNHSLWFTDPHTGINTNTVEGNNYALKRHVPNRSRTENKLQDYLLEFIWRRKYKLNLWRSFINALKEISYN
jgi:hypothetical protein